jgi:hypothetical protein
MVPSFDAALVRGVASYALELFDAARMRFAADENAKA